MKNPLFITVLLAAVALVGVSAIAGERLNNGLMGAGAAPVSGVPSERSQAA